MAAAGDKIGGFSLVRQLGSGGMGETWEAIRRGDHGFEQRVALKLANRAVLHTPEGLELFRREASLAASLRHPNIASVLDVDERQGYLVYELVDGADLRSVLRETPRGKLSPALLVYVLAQIARALAHAHKRVLHGQLSPVVHRDMSPGNVVVDYDGNLKVVDFGIAKATAVGERSETIKGKLSYMAPEQAMGTEVDGRVDQYALGVMAYEMVAGVRPNDGAHDGETLAKILGGQHVPVTKRAPEIAAGLGEIIERMLATRPEERFPDMDAVIDALSAFNPPLTVHRELAALVLRAHPPHTIVTQGGAFVSVPVPAQALPAARAPLARTLDGPPGAPAHGAAPSDRPGGRPSPRPSLPPTETLEKRGVGSPRAGDLAHAQTQLAPQSAPRLQDELSAPFSPPAPRWRMPVLGLGAVLVLGVIGWAMLSETHGAPAPTDSHVNVLGGGTSGGTLAANSPAGASAPPTGAAPSSPSMNSEPAHSTSPTDSALAAVVTTAPAAPLAAAPLAAAQTAVPAAASEPAAPKRDAAPKRESDRDHSTARSPHPHRSRPSPPAPAEPAAPAASAPSASARGTALVRVKVFPWGRVWIDGKVRGSVPPILEANVAPGTHEIAVGHEQPMDTRKVTVSAGGSELVSFDLEGK